MSLEIEISAFAEMPMKDKHRFFQSISREELTKIKNDDVLKRKYIALRVLREAESALEPSLFNLTAQFRKLIALYDNGLKLASNLLAQIFFQPMNVKK